MLRRSHLSVLLFILGIGVLTTVRARGDVVYVDNASDGTITRIEPDGTTSIFASGLTSPRGMALDSTGSLYVGTQNGIRRITPAGVVSSFAAIGPVDGLAFDGNGNLYAGREAFDEIDKITSDGTVTKWLSLSDAIDPAWDGDTLYITRPAAVVKVTPDGTLTGVASFPHPIPGGIAFAPDGKLYAESNGVIYKISASGVVTMFTTLSQVSAAFPTGLAFDSAGNLYVPSGSNLDRISPDGQTTVLAAGLHGPEYVAVQVPEPAEMGTLAIACIGLLRRRRGRLPSLLSAGRITANG